jgi:HlyD family secretion protein
VTSSRKAVVLLAVAAAIGIGVSLGVWRLNGNATAAADVPGFKAFRGPLTLSIGGVGRVVPAGGAIQTIANGTGASGGTSETPGYGVFARTTGNVKRILVSPGQHVAAGQPLMLLEDGGAAAAAIAQAQNDLSSAKLELQQKRTSDPTKGIPPTPAEFAAARLAVTTARLRLSRLSAPPRPADVSTARLELKRAEADLETLQGGTAETRQEALLLAQQNVQLAQGRLDRILAPPLEVDVAAAVAEVKRTEAELNAQGYRTDRAALPSEIAAARAAVDAARAKLARVQLPADPSDVAAARLELDRAKADLRRIQAGPSAVALDAARQAVTAARARLAQVLSPVPASDVSAARLEVQRAEAELAVLNARRGPSSATDVAIARLKVEGAGARLAGAQLAAQPLTVRSPWAGTVTSVLASLGARIDPASPVAVMANLETLEATVDLSEFDVAQVKPGQKVIVSVDALGGETFQGKVLFTALAGTSSGGVVTFPVRVSIPEAEGLKPGMNVSVRIVVAKRNGVVQVPLEAVSVDDEDRASVMVIRPDGDTVVRKVKLGLETTKNVEILKGLRVGELVELAEVAAPEEEA